MVKLSAADSDRKVEQHERSCGDGVADDLLNRGEKKKLQVSGRP
jgi:hypothetical protein